MRAPLQEDKPPKDNCVAVRVLQTHGALINSTGRVVLNKGTVLNLPEDEVEPLLKAGIVQHVQHKWMG